MPLPYPSMNFTAFDILTAAEMNELVANIESLADGSGIGDGAIKSSNIDWTTVPATVGAWSNWTPTWTNLTVGNGTLNARFMEFGKTVRGKISFILGSTSSITGNVLFTLPRTATALVAADSFYSVGVGEAQDVGSATILCRVRLNSTTLGQIYAINAAGTYAQPSGFGASSPFNWVSGDGFTASFEYEKV